MKTTMEITVEKVDDGIRCIISHKGDVLRSEINELVAAIQYYWNAVVSHEEAKQNLPVMKEKRKAMKQRVKESGAYINEFQTAGWINEKPKPQSDLSDTPF